MSVKRARAAQVSALLGDMTKLGGTVLRTGSVAYVAQVGPRVQGLKPHAACPSCLLSGVHWKRWRRRVSEKGAVADWGDGWLQTTGVRAMSGGHEIWVSFVRCKA